MLLTEELSVSLSFRHQVTSFAKTSVWRPDERRQLADNTREPLDGVEGVLSYARPCAGSIRALCDIQ